MKITVFTCNQPRHNYLINLLSKIADELYVVQECYTIFPGKNKGLYKKNLLVKKYFKKVKLAEKKIFKDSIIENNNKLKKILPLSFGDLNKCSTELLKNFLKSDIYIVFGCSFIKGKLANFLIEKKALNIHIGVAPFYRGTDCNFWALLDKNSDLVGATVHYLSKKLDGGKILFHALSEHNEDPFLYSMSTVKSAFFAITKYIKENKKKIKTYSQNKKDLVRYSRRADFNNKSIQSFFKSKIQRKDKISGNFKNPFILKKTQYFK
jgi:hypothetical protein